MSNVYSEGKKSTFTHNGKEYQLDTVFSLTVDRRAVSVNIDKLKWVLKHTSIDKSRVEKADISVPVLIYDDPKYGLTVVDGAHRLYKAVEQDKQTISAIILTKSDMEIAEINNKISTESESKAWDPTFGPSFTPEEMLRKGIFEGKYINNIKGIPVSWKSIDKVLGPKDEPDEKINYHGVKSRQPLSVWKENGWIKTDKNGWFEWYILYWLGRRLGEEDKWQIGRWRSFVARHQGQVSAKCKLGDDKCNTRQRQGLLQWGWNSHEKWSDEEVLKNAKRMAKETSTKLEEDKKVAKESIALPAFSNW